MSALTSRDFFERLMREHIEADIERIKDMISNGHLENHADYKFACGQIAGLRSAIEAMDAASSETQKYLRG